MSYVGSDYSAFNTNCFGSSNNPKMHNKVLYFIVWYYDKGACKYYISKSVGGGDLRKIPN